MSFKSKTIYPQYPVEISKDYLNKFFTPTDSDLNLSHNKTMTALGQWYYLYLLMHFKMFGFFSPPSGSPREILAHLASKVKISTPTLSNIEDFETTRKYFRYIASIKQLLNVQKFKKSNLSQTAINIANTKSFIIDIINGTIEYLFNNNIELPGYETIEDACIKAKKQVESKIYESVYNKLHKSEKKSISKDVLVYVSGRITGWEKLKSEPANITYNNIGEHIAHIEWLQKVQVRKSVFKDIADVKIESLYEDSLKYNFSRVVRFGEIKKVAIAAIVIYKSMQSYMDDLVEIFIKTMRNLENKSKQDFNDYKFNRFDDATYLVGKFNEVLNIYKKKQSKKKMYSGLNNVIGDEVSELSEKCKSFNAYEHTGYLHFLEKRYNQHSLHYSSIIKFLTPKPATDVSDIVDMFNYLVKAKLSADEDLHKLNTKKFNNKWIKGKWKKLIFAKKQHIYLSRFELLVNIKLATAFNNREIYIEDGHRYSNFRDSLISRKYFEEKVFQFCLDTNISSDPDKFTTILQGDLSDACHETDTNLKTVGKTTIKNGRLRIGKIISKSEPKGFDKVSDLIAKNMSQVSLLDIIGKIFRSLNLKDYFKLPETESEESYSKRLIATMFCYGCNLSAAEAERSIFDINRRAIGWVNSDHITLELLERCSANVINVYNKFQLPKYWGDGSHVSVDGTKWDIYTKNLMAEFHVRYKGHGGIAYYHVSDKYIAIFSNFISCGVYEGRYLLDALEENKSDIQPEFVHGDTHAQSLVIFGLAYLLGIKIMPRIRHLNDLAYFKADKSESYTNIEFLFKNRFINWNLIKNNYLDMLRVAMSIRYGKVKPSEILKRIGANNGNNVLYKAFRELGRVIRTTFIMNYIGDFDLRKIIHSATCKSEEFNDYVNWIAFADDVIRQNKRLNQKKFIKYNQLVTNMVLLYNVQEMSKIVNDLKLEDVEIPEEFLKGLSPYRKDHINRLGTYKIDLIDYENYLKQWAYDIN